MKRRFILVDTENVQNRWFELLRGLREKDKIIVFYTENHSKKLQDYLEVSKGGKRLRWVECISGENALDYQLLGVLSYLIYIHPKAEYTIYSNDKGYQDAVSSWKDKGVCIRLAGFSTERVKEDSTERQEKHLKRGDSDRQENSSKRERQEQLDACDEQQGKQADENGPADDNKVRKGAETTGRGKRKRELKKKQKSVSEVDGCVWEIGKSLSFAEKAAYHALLVDFLGQEEGRRQYQIIRKSKECQEILKECYLDDSRERAVCLIQTILQYHELDMAYGKVIYQILQKGDLNNLQAIKKSFDNRIGAKAEYQKYYSVMKRYFHLIKEMTVNGYLN